MYALCIIRLISDYKSRNIIHNVSDMCHFYVSPERYAQVSGIWIVHMSLCLSIDIIPSSLHKVKYSKLMILELPVCLKVADVFCPRRFSKSGGH